MLSEKRREYSFFISLVALAALFVLARPALARDQPFIVHDTKPVIMQGPYITSLALGQDQIAKMDATRSELRVTVIGKDGAIIETMTIKSRR